MIKNFLKNNFCVSKNKELGLSLLEIIISIAIFSMILMAVVSFISSMNTSNLKTKSDRESLENAQRALDEITYEIRSATSIYTPTTTAHQLSLETSRYIPSGETDTFIDFFLCGTAVCFKKESQDAITLTSDSVKVTNLVFSQISTGASPSVQISLTVNSVNGGNPSTTTLTSTAALRSY